MRAALTELLVFAGKEARSCVFAAAFFAILVLSHVVVVPGLARYDLILLACVAVQLALVATGVETRDEVLVLLAFHGLGLGLELFKTHPAIGSWSYPEPGVAKLAGVPLYSGFMYAAVASYVCQAWRVMRLELVAPPAPAIGLALAAAIYLNFFTHHITVDLRWGLTAAVLWAYRHTWVRFTVIETPRRMPLVLAFALIGFFIWIAENLATAGGAWAYPDQRLGWRAVSLGKIHSWALLVIVTVVLVALLKDYKRRRGPAAVGGVVA